MSVVRIPSFEEILAVSHSRGGMSYAPGLWAGLVGAWPLQEPGGLKAFDASGYGNHGTLTNMDPATDRVVTAKGRALDFDGSNDYISVPDSARLSPLAYTKKMTIGLLVRPTSDFGYYICKGDDPSGQYEYGLYDSSTSTGFRVWSLGGGEIWSVIVAARMSLNSWHSLVATCDDTARADLWLDGIWWAEDTVRTAGACQDGSSLLNIGRRRADLHPACRMAAVAIWNRVLSPREIAGLWIDPWAMYRQRRRVFAAATAPPAGNRRRRFLLVGADT